MVSFQGSIGRNPALMEATRGAWIERKAANPEMHFAVSGFCMEDYTRDLEAAGIPVYEEATHATRAIACFTGLSGSGARRTASPLNEIDALDVVAAAVIVRWSRGPVALSRLWSWGGIL